MVVYQRYPKLLTTSTTADVIEECRKLCSGHGYLCNSGLPELFVVYVPACTYEGDNVVFLIQIARFLMKTVSQLGSGKQPVGTTAYMGRVEHLLQCCSDVQQAEDWLKPTAILEAFEARAARMSVACAQNISKMPSQDEDFAKLSSELVETGVAHCQLIVVSKFIEKLKQDIPRKLELELKLKLKLKLKLRWCLKLQPRIHTSLHLKLQTNQLHHSSSSLGGA
ncbi:hypothetical protein GIB67_016142 [Kingdonia uniflora]|uniref:Acyl-CoA oxidase C-terminal domain-containing protein n=1 Tax=Kingdonia uniflora TaxID=39325 RepID=A0A7J7N9W3_9MAGN|nr:hypothetical protein GIB67_016142 [Kingdonia uniflora]